MKAQISDIDPEVWRRSRVAALGMGKTMGEFVELALKDLLHVVTQTIERKPKASVVGAIPVAKPSMDDLDPSEVITGKCSKCGDNFTVTTLIPHPQFPNKKFCPGCVENMKNGQG